MGKLVDMTGEKVGRLTVLARAEKKVHGRVGWLCKCVCGREVKVSGKDLRSRHTRSCGCLAVETRMAHCINSFKDLSGKNFGKLTAVRKTGERRNRCIVWYCVCECGGEKYATSSALLRGHVRSCGCLKCLNLEGKRFGRLTVLRKAGRTRNRAMKWECLCDCGETRIITMGALTNGLTKSCGCFFKEMTKSGKWTKNIAKAQLCSHSSLTIEDLPEDLIELQVMQININRQLKEMTL